jgi:exonuclease VII small subunit
MIIYGSPGVGKTTLALSAPKPVLLDFDRGISRVRAAHRKATAVCSTYEEVLQDIQSPAMADFETVVIDTGGSFITFLKDWAMRTKQGAKLKNGEFNGLKGYGFVKTEFSNFTEMLKTTLNKNIIYVFHSVESTDKDGNPVQRLMCEGATKNTVWTPCDFGGYVQMIGENRVICFTPEQEFFAKGCHGISGKYTIPALGPDDSNDFLTKLFDQAKENITEENNAFAPVRAQYEAVMEEVRAILEAITTAEEATEAAMEIPTMEHALTSKKECSALLNARAKQLGLRWNKTAGRYEKAGA